MSVRDMSRQQYLNALKRNGLEPVGFMGYVTRINNSTLAVCARNAGENHRAQLAYVLAAFAKHEARAQAEKEAVTA